MSQDDLLSQEEIDALLNGVSGDDDKPADDTPGEKRTRPFDPANQHRIIRERLHALDIINERFARLFRVAMFNLIRRSADITVTGVRYQSYSEFARNLPVPTNLNLISLKPLKGTALLVFPPSLVFMVVDNLFGGDGRFLTKSDGREFTATEQRIIQRLMTLALEGYGDAWKSVYPLEIEYMRSEMQVRFANITNSPNEIVVNSTFHLEVGNLASDFNICIPFSMIEPIRDVLSSPIGSYGSDDTQWESRMAGEIKQTQVELIADFAEVDSTIAEVMSLKVGDVLPIDLPKSLDVRVDGVPVMACEYGTREGHRALRVKHLIDHGTYSAMKDFDNE
ncbi:flagellar motor switch protein FliM [Salinicola rhizosphaerae]|uniref:Flagellar motor switch protein FliM n=1 Tax=Salinicola rhizosphaerae TaxID=1443141 RepID=A0ABQ3DPQ4_9GAMM|nr:flagellar motor switch protein FliM [Salinicola rhizosphaerae]GHB08647.1 flagellar motor switch protein FliM [Salinicola rhizosphaerae]